MAVFYLDTSAILKRYRREQGTEVVDRLLLNPAPEDRFYTSFLSALEVRSAISRLVRSGQLNQSLGEHSLARFHEDTHRDIRLWPLDNSMLSAALTVADRHGLRSGDAIHLATAEVIFRLTSESDKVFVSSDRELLEAAVDSGMEVLDPQNPT